jgi:hypothetical protein
MGRNSLNSQIRKKQHDKQIAENVMMLKKIHFAEPTIKFSEQQKHSNKAERLKQLISNGGARQSMMHAARAMIFSPEASCKRGNRPSSHQRTSSAKKAHGSYDMRSAKAIGFQIHQEPIVEKTRKPRKNKKNRDANPS